MKRVLLIDGNSFCYRAFYAIKSLTTSRGQPTNAVFGFVNMLNKLQQTYQPHYLGVAFDLKGPTFRHQQFSDYKKQRKPMPDELSVQIPVIKKILRTQRIPIFEEQGYEADDIIATLARKIAGPELEVLIVTSDKDMLQLVGEVIKIINPHKEDLIMDAAWVKAKFGVGPEKIVEIMALSGDKIDNIPGVPGIGEATAVELIKQFGTLDNVLTNVKQIAHKARRAKIQEFSAQARLSRELVQLDCAVPGLRQKSVQDILSELNAGGEDKTALMEIYKELEFKSLWAKLAPVASIRAEFEIVSDSDEVEQYAAELSRQDDLVLHILTNKLHPLEAEILGLAFSRQNKQAVFFPFSPDSLERLKPLLENKGMQKSGHDLKEAKLVLFNYGIKLEGLSFDTMLAAYLLEPSRLNYGLADLAWAYLNYRLEDAQLPVSAGERAAACVQNIELIRRLREILRKELQEKDLMHLFQQVEMPLLEVLSDMEQEGVALDRDLLKRYSRDFEEKAQQLTKEIYEMAGEEFNINSPKQLSFILFEKLKLPKIKRTKTGSSTDTEVLQKLLSAHPIASCLLQFREIAKLKSTYLDGMDKLINPRTGKVHTSFNQTGTATGRLSSSQPNLQNIPIRTNLGKKIRRIFIAAGKNSLLLSADYSQIELRLLAHLSGDKGLIAAFSEDLDIHAYTASLIFGVAAEKVSAQMRDTAKTVNFGIIYGMSAFGLAKDLGIGQTQAQEFIDAYFKRYPGVQDYIVSQIEKAKKLGYVDTILKRRRYIPQINSPDEQVSRFAQRVAINAPVQGSASDLIKVVMVEIYRAFKTKGLVSKMVIQVHDELVFSVVQDELDECKAIIQEKMEQVVKLRVPIKVSLKVGHNWLDMQ